ncbi:MAG: hypothetical protein ACD_54C00787G0001 [uncultured bacterium]|nr:MAG: hypothetical protein ACD_54C00787G0001 [uncultured bacterium]
MRESPRQCLLIPQHHIRAASPLHRMVFAQRLFLLCRPGQKQIATRVEIQIWPVVAHPHGFGKIPDEGRTELADLHVDRI